MEKCSNQVVRTCDVIGKKVLGRDNESLGKVEEIVLDKVNGEVRYAVLSFGGFMGLGDDFYALPWKTLEYCQPEDAFKVNVAKETLKSASGFNKDNWPDFASASWSKSINDFYTSL